MGCALTIQASGSHLEITGEWSAVDETEQGEWMEDLHKHFVAGTDAWRESDCDGDGLLPMQDPEDWNHVTWT
jgi:alpha-1,3-glucan synthase